MLQLCLIGIGTGNPKHLTLEAVEAIRAQDLILIPHKGAGKDDLAGLRQAICAEVLTGVAHPPKIVEFDLPVRDPATADYRQRVDNWHDAIAEVWQATLAAHLPEGGQAGFLVWGDPSLYDSTMRIAERLKEAQNTAAMLTTFNEVDMSGVIAARARHRERFEAKHGVKLGFMSFFAKACVVALNEVPAVNAEIDDTDIVYRNYVDLGIAVGTEQGLVVPVLRDAGHKTFAEIENEIAALGRGARINWRNIEKIQEGGENRW